MNCDFCGQETNREEIMVVPTKTFVIPEINFRNESWGWGACPGCAAHIFCGEMDSLLDRAVAHHPNGEAVRDVLDVVYAAVKANQNGPLRSWHPMDEGEP